MTKEIEKPLFIYVETYLLDSNEDLSHNIFDIAKHISTEEFEKSFNDNLEIIKEHHLTIYIEIITNFNNKICHTLYFHKYDKPLDLKYHLKEGFDYFKDKFLSFYNISDYLKS